MMLEEGAGAPTGIADAKRTLRAHMRHVRDALPQDARTEQSKGACAQLLEMPALQNARIVAVFSAFGSEISLDPLIEHLSQRRSMRLVAPVPLGQTHMEFVEIEAHELLDRAQALAFLVHPARIPKDGLPRDRKIVPANDLDFMVVPGLAFDEECARLGYGGGYYDAYLARPNFRAFTCGICFDEQLLASGTRVPCDSHDRTLNAVITPTRTITRTV